jgi:hypothetical protein
MHFFNEIPIRKEDPLLNSSFTKTASRTPNIRRDYNESKGKSTITAELPPLLR